MNKLALLFFVGCLAASSAAAPSAENSPRSTIQLVAFADGKAFFAGSEWRDRLSAIAFCKSLGLTLASITSSTQWDALDQAYNPDTFNDIKAYWTSGQDSLTLNQFRWNSTDAVDVTFATLEDVMGQPLTCLAYRSNPGKGTSTLRNLPCTSASGIKQPVLCQTNQ